MNFEKVTPQTTESTENASPLEHGLKQELILSERFGKMGKLTRGLLAGFLLMTAVGCTQEEELTPREAARIHRQPLNKVFNIDKESAEAFNKAFEGVINKTVDTQTKNIENIVKIGAGLPANQEGK